MRKFLSAICCCSNLYRLVLCFDVMRWLVMLALMFGRLTEHGLQKITPAEIVNPWFGNFASLSSRLMCLASAVVRAILARPRGPSGGLRLPERTRSWLASSTAAAGAVAPAEDEDADDMVNVSVTLLASESETPRSLVRLI